MPPRDWGWWTQHKLDILGNYLQSFATASSKVPERIYLDLFAGEPDNVSRETNEPIRGSVHRALAANPPFSRLCLFELPKAARLLETELRKQYPERRGVRVYPGDCNATIGQALADLRRVGLDWAPTFAFVDQYDTEVNWSTLEEISAFKNPRRTKAEMWILFGTSFYARGLRLRQESLDAEYAAGLTAMFGTDQWRSIAEGRRRELLRPEEWRAELVNLMRWRLHKDLGYRQVPALTIRNTAGQHLYNMIFATDHEAGDRIMSFLYGRSPQQQEAMRHHARVLRQDRRRREAGEDALFAVSAGMFTPLGDGFEQAVIQDPPHEPYTLPKP
jgi:three-Cys-motif partner protein